MYKRHALGKMGENMAVKYLERKGYKILERNFYCKRGEIDIIAMDKDYLVFIEIKTRASNEYGLPSESVTKRKIKHMIDTIQYFLYTRHLENENIRIDVIEIYTDDRIKINHLKQVI